MRLCIITPDHAYLDEGLGNTANHFTQIISRSHQVLLLKGTSSFTSLKGWQSLKHFKPEIVHIFLPCTFSSLLLAKIISCYCQKVKVVFSAYQPPWNTYLISILRKILKPDVVLIQSSNTGRIFSNLGFKTRILPSGVNTEKFKPVTLVRKRELREKYSIAVDKYVIMHVGPILRQRNIQILEKLQRDPENQVVIIGSTAINADKKLILELVNCGCKVWVKYMENLEEIYQLSDVYVFPTTDQSHSAIDQPLSVIEAMSCNIPVISTPFGGLPDIFKEDGGIYFFTLEADLLSKINALKSGTSKIYTKDKAYHRSWDNIAGELEEIYRTL